MFLQKLVHWLNEMNSKRRESDWLTSNSISADLRSVAYIHAHCELYAYNQLVGSHCVTCLEILKSLLGRKYFSKD